LARRPEGNERWRYGTITLKWIFEEENGVAGSCKHIDELSCSITRLETAVAEQLGASKKGSEQHGWLAVKCIVLGSKLTAQKQLICVSLRANVRAVGEGEEEVGEETNNAINLTF
jgi:hypothetical protein